MSALLSRSIFEGWNDRPSLRKMSICPIVEPATTWLLVRTNRPLLDSPRTITPEPVSSNSVACGSSSRLPDLWATRWTTDGEIALATSSKVRLMGSNWAYWRASWP